MLELTKYDKNWCLKVWNENEDDDGNSHPTRQPIVGLALPKVRLVALTHIVFHLGHSTIITIIIVIVNFIVNDDSSLSLKKSVFFPATARSYNDKVDDYMQVSSNAKEENIADKDWGNLAGKKLTTWTFSVCGKYLVLRRKWGEIQNSFWWYIAVWEYHSYSGELWRKKMKKWHLCSFMLFAFKIS